jgi:succinate dehydrogenase / fumarate reductase cytochrome b subunit
VTEAAAHTEDASKPLRELIASRLATVLAIAPLGVWTVWHLWDNLNSWRGGEAWGLAVTGGSQLSHAIGAVIVLVPLVLHTIWGIVRVMRTRPNLGAYPYYANLKYLVQRLTALGLLGFLGAHLWLAAIKPRLTEGHPEEFADLAKQMHHHMPTLGVYLLGTLAVAYHLANGVQTSAIALGLVTTRDGLKRLDKVSLVLFVIFAAMAWGAIGGLYRAGV